MMLADDLATAVAARDDAYGWQRQPDGHYDARSWTPERLAPYDRAWVSGYGATLINGVRLRVVDALGATAPYMPGELARAYLRSDDMLGGWLAEGAGSAGQHHRIPYHRQAKAYLDIPAPEWFEPPADRNGPWSLVDIVTCYHALSCRYGAVCEYRPQWVPPLLRCIGPAFVRAQELAPLRPVRLATWGMLRGPGIYEYRHGAVQARMRPNRYCSPDLVGVVMETMHAIAQEAITAFPTACIWYRDAVVLRPAEAEAYIAWLAARWRLEATVRATGPGYVWGKASRAIGPDVTADVLAGRCYPHRASSNLQPLPARQRDWLAGVAA